MAPQRRTETVFVFLGLAIAILSVASVCLGSVNAPLSEVAKALFKPGAADPVLSAIIYEFRIPRTFTGVLGGAGLAVSGLMMQTVFRNPLADPFVLGVSSGASLGVAIALLVLGPGGVVLTASYSLSGSVLVVCAASMGAGAVLLMLLILSHRVDVMSLLILGIMISYGVGSVVSILIFYSMADRLQVFFNWSFGNFASITWEQLRVFAPIVCVGLAASFPLIKILDAFLLGERYARSMGVNVKGARAMILGCASLLAGAVTGFCGPIGFIGIAAPHFARYLFKSSQHRVLAPGSIAIGAIVGLVSDLLARAPGLEATLPLNSVTALIGTPVIIAALLRQKNYRKLFGGQI